MRCIVGIDLGTTQSALAYASQSPDATGDIVACPIAQLVAPGEIGQRPTLPSFLYLPGDHELPDGALALPWAPARDYAVGELARRQGANVPGRLIASAKSWLSHGGVDRTKPLLPWGGDESVARLSTVEVQARYLTHLAEAWAAHWAVRGESMGPLGEHELVLTVPASFDAVARELTLEAARKAGLAAHLTLLEEPQAAFYAWLASEGDPAASAGGLHPGELVLVCDVGGGTTDFTLIRAQPSSPTSPTVSPAASSTPAGGATREDAAVGPVELERIAVGEHLLLGGDNMDLALARRLEASLSQGAGRALGGGDFALLVQRCREAKELLLGAAPPESVKVVLPGRGSKLLAAAAQAVVSRADVEELLVEGFFPRVAREAQPERGLRAGLGEWGLPYASDPAITRHLAAFLQRHGGALPDAVLFNGGVFAAAPLRRRVLDLIATWRGGAAPRELVPRDAGLELAVAWGAAAYGLARHGRGQRVRAGAGHAYYIEVAAPIGKSLRTGEIAAVCVAARGQAIGVEHVVGGSGSLDLRLRANRPVQFRLLSSASRQDPLGAVVLVGNDELHELAPLTTVLRYGRPSVHVEVPVRLCVQQTELGTLELALSSDAPSRAGAALERWKLQFDLRGTPALASAGSASAVAADVAPIGDEPPARVPETSSKPLVDSAMGLVGEPTNEPTADHLANAVQLITDTFRPPAVAAQRPQPAALPKALEQALGRGRTEWTSATLRQLWEPLREAFGRHTESPEHEARWLHLAGYTLRPGIGLALDDWRLRDAWRAFHTPLTHERDERVRIESWVLWRRVAAGLRAGQQDELLKRIAPVLNPPNGRPVAWRKPPTPQEAQEMWRCAAVLERVAATAKVALGDALLARIDKRDTRKDRLGYAVWAIARLGARQLVYGPAQSVVPPKVATGWIEKLLTIDGGVAFTADELGFALAQLARRTEDRARDIDEALRQRVVDWVQPLPAGERLATLVQEAAPPRYSEQEQKALLGEALPPGLTLGNPA